jgi:hypothetical protein
MWLFNATPQPVYPREKDSVSIVLEAGWATGPVWRERKIQPSGFDPWTVQRVANRYAD